MPARSRTLVLALAAAGFTSGCKSTDAPATPPRVAIVNRTNVAYTFGVVAFTTPTQTDTLTHSTGNDSVCLAMPAVGDAYETFYGTPADTANKADLTTQVIIGSASPGWELLFAPQSAGSDTLVISLYATSAC